MIINSEKINRLKSNFKIFSKIILTKDMETCNGEILVCVNLTPNSVQVEVLNREFLNYINYNFNECLKLKITSDILKMVWDNMLRDKHELCWRDMRRDTDFD